MISPLIRIRVAQLLARRYKMDSEQAVNTAEDLITLIQTGGLDIVAQGWMAKVDQPEKRTDFWDGVAQQIDRLDEQFGDWHPWRP